MVDDATRRLVAEDRIAELEARIAALEEALRFYADPATYQMTADMDPQTRTFHHTPAHYIDDQGARARAALTPPADRR